jgi:predicted phosphodiesterase
LFERHHVQLVLSGHQHNYQRGTRAQVLYVITGGAGGNLDREMVESYGFYDKTVIDHHYLILTIDPKAITGKVYSFSNRKIDEWKIKAIN